MLTPNFQLLNDLLSSIDKGNQFSAQPTKQTPTANTPRPVPRPTPGTNGTTQAQPLKRKAETEPNGGQNKMQRKDDSRPDRITLPTRVAPAPSTTKPKSATPSNAVTYRGTAGSGGLSTTKAAETIAKKATPVGRTTSASSKTVPPVAPRVAAVPAAAGNPPVPTKKGSYAAMLMAAKQKDQTKPIVPPVKHEVPKFLKKKEIEALKRAGPTAVTNGKKSASAGPAKPVGGKSEPNKEKRKPAELGYQGTARPAKKPVEIGYKGTARPSSAPTGATEKSTRTPTGKAKPKPSQGSYGGYARWSDVEEMEDEEEEKDGYDSDASSDMEANPWDMENEEEEALKAAKREDALALKEENEHKRQKLERNRKLAALAAKQKKKF